jgi:(p)ppGpp synthase/HD superfamily hydrolase
MEVFASWTGWPSAEQALATRLPASTVAALARAYAFAEEHHGDQTRPAGEPYVHHLLEALEIAVDSGATDPDVLVAVLLHDVGGVRLPGRRTRGLGDQARGGR